MSSAASLALAAFAVASAPAPEVQRPAGLTEKAAPEEATPEEAAPEEAAPESTAEEAAPEATAEEAAPEEAAPEETAPAAEPVAAEAEGESTQEASSADSGEKFVVAEGEGRGGPPYYSEADAQALRKRHGVEASPPVDTRKAKWRCLIADPTCGISFEIDATAAYAYRGRQGDTRREGGDPRWHSGRAQYDFWLNIPVMVESRGKSKYTRMTLGPKGGVIFSDSGSLWGNLGMAARYWLGRGRFAPAIEFTSALSYKLGSRPTQDLGGAKPKFRMTRGPVGFTADVGIGIGGFGAIVIGGQYDSPLAREDIPEQFRVSAGGTFFVGFRGNILWGAPAAAAIMTHGLTQRYAQEP